jgi:DNA ligase-1
MQRFSRLMTLLERENRTSQKIEILAAFFQSEPHQDAVWALYLLCGRKLKRLVKRSQLASIVQEVANIPPWLFDESYAVVGDLAETCALLWPESLCAEHAAVDQNQDSPSLHHWMTERCPSLGKMAQTEAKDSLRLWWRSLSRYELFIAIKLLTGGFRAGVAQGLVVKALAKAFDLPVTGLLEALSGDWPVTDEWFGEMVRGTPIEASSPVPLPFYLASPLEGDPLSLGEVSEYCFEWKWDGIRAQIIKSRDRVAIWSRGEELISDRFPELLTAAREISEDFILDGEILAVNDNGVRPFSDLQTRIGRKKPSAKLIAEIPVNFYAFDCLKWGEKDLRPASLRERRERLEALLADHRCLFPSPALACSSWEEAAHLRLKAKEQKVEGLMIKKWDSPYLMGRKRGAFWKWKVDPMTLDAVLIYAQAGHGRRATLYTDYTFALWKDGQLVPFAKAYSGLDDKAIRELDAWIRKHTIERFGPVRSVEPIRVFEIAFEGIGRSPRHKSGIAVRFPRILRERTDKKAPEADSVESAIALIQE